MRIVAGLLLAALTAWGADVSGQWVAAVDTSFGSGSPSFVFKQEGEKLSGDYTGALGTAKLTGTVKGEAVEFSFKGDANGQEITITYKGKLSADGMKIAGSVSYGSLGDGTFTATRR